MDRIRRAELQELVEWKQGPCVSLFMPMHVKDRNAMEDPAPARAGRRSEESLEDGLLRRAEAEKLLAPLRDLPLDDEAWQHRGCSLAFFGAGLSPDHSHGGAARSAGPRDRPLLRAAARATHYR